MRRTEEQIYRQRTLDIEEKVKVKNGKINRKHEQKETEEIKAELEGIYEIS